MSPGTSSGRGLGVRSAISSRAAARGARERARHCLKDALDLGHPACKVPAPKGIARVLEQLDEGDEEPPLLIVCVSVCEREGENEHEVEEQGEVEGEMKGNVPGAGGAR